MSICKNYLCTGGRKAWNNCVCVHLCMFFTPTTSRSQVLNLWYAFIFPLHYPNMKKVVLKCSKITVCNHWCCVPFMPVFNFVFCVYTPCGFRDYFVPETVAVGHGEELSVLVEIGSVRCIAARGIAMLGGRCVELCLQWSCASACPSAGTSPCKSGSKHHVGPPTLFRA